MILLLVKNSSITSLGSVPSIGFFRFCTNSSKDKVFLISSESKLVSAPLKISRVCFCILPLKRPIFLLQIFVLMFHSLELHLVEMLSISFLTSTFLTFFKMFSSGHFPGLGFLAVSGTKKRTVW